MTMRKREEIEQDLDSIDERVEKEDSHYERVWGIWRMGQLQLEALLDIRELLSPHPLDLASMNPEQQRKFIEEWKRAENDRP